MGQLADPVGDVGAMLVASLRPIPLPPLNFANN